METEEAVSKLKHFKPPPSGEENYQYLLDKWNHENTCTFKDFLHWYNIKDFVPTLEAMQKTLAFYHKKRIDLLKLGCTLPNSANICLQKPMSAIFYAFTETDEDLLQKIREGMVDGPSIVFRREAVVDETLIRNSRNVCKSIVSIDASQFYPHSMCHPMPTGLYTRWECDTESNRFKPQRNKSRSFENVVVSFFQRQTPDCKIKNFYTRGIKKIIECFKADGFCAHCNTVFEAMGCIYHYCPCQKAPSSLTADDIKRGNKRREMDQMRKQYIKEKGYNVDEMWECEWWNLYKTTMCVKVHLRESFPYERPLREERLSEQIRIGKLFGYVQCDIEVPEELKKVVANFPPFFKNTSVGRHDIGLLMKDSAERKELLCQPRKKLISSYFLEKGTLIAPLLLFYLDLGLVCKKYYGFVEYIPVNCFNKFVQSAVNARREADENPNSSVAAATMKLLANSSYGYQIMNRSRHTVTKYLSDKKKHGAINTKLFKRLHEINDHFYEVELAKAEIEHRELIFFGFFILHYAKLRTLELYCNFFERFCHVKNFEELEMDTVSL